MLLNEQMDRVESYETIPLLPLGIVNDETLRMTLLMKHKSKIIIV